MLIWWRGKTKSGITRTSLTVILLAAFAFCFYFWRLGSLTRGLSPAEVSARSSSSTLQIIADNPVYAPYKILAYAVQKIFDDGALALRSVSAVLALLFLFCFYQLVKEWFGKMVSVFASLFLAATPWFILLARNSGPEISLLAPTAVLASYYWLIRSKSHVAWWTLLICSSLLIYLPGGLWLVLLGGVFARKSLKQAARELDLQARILGILVLLIFLAPLAYAVISNPAGLKPLLLIAELWPSILIVCKSVAWDILALLWRTPVHADFIIGRLPIFNGAQIILALLGSFALLKLAKDKLYLLFGLLIFGILAAAVNRNLGLLTYVLPAAALSVAAGLRYLYIQWRSVFPKNPLPKYLALSLIASLVAIHGFYGLRYSLIAWPNSSATRTTYVLK